MSNGERSRERFQFFDFDFSAGIDRAALNRICARRLGTLRCFLTIGTSPLRTGCSIVSRLRIFRFLIFADVYHRLNGTKLNAYRTEITFLQSAVWHGFYPGYYLSFFTANMFVQLSRLARSTLRPMFIDENDKPRPGKLIYDIAGLFVTRCMIEYTFSSFIVSLLVRFFRSSLQLLEYEGSVALWSALSYSGHLIMIVAYVALRVLRSTRTKSTKSTKTQ